MFRTLSLVNTCQRRALFFSSKPKKPLYYPVRGDGKSLQHMLDYLEGLNISYGSAKAGYVTEEIYAYSLNLGKQIKELDRKLDELNKKLDAK